MNKLKKRLTIALFVGIPLIPLLTFWFIPMIVSVWLSSTDWDYISPDFSYVMLDNYKQVLTSSDFHQALWNTVFFGFWTVLPTVALGLGLALIVRKQMVGQTFFKGLLFTPWITPMVAVSIVWSWIYEPTIGLFNQILGFLHLPQPQWLTDPEYAMWAIIIVTIWKNAGWAMLFYLDALSKIPDELYQVGDLEGANAWHRLRHITLPLISPTTLFLVVLSAIDSIQAYDQIQVMTQGGPAGSTRTLLYLYYQLAFEQFNMGEATAVATLIVLLTALLAFILFFVSKRWVHY